MSAKYKLQIIAPSKLVGTIIELLEEEGCLISMEAVSEAPARKKSFRYIDGKRLKGISGDSLVLKTISESPNKRASREAILKAFHSSGFATSSFSARTSQMKKQGLISLDSKGDFFIPPTLQVAKGSSK